MWISCASSVVMDVMVIVMMVMMILFLFLVITNSDNKKSEKVCDSVGSAGPGA